MALLEREAWAKCWRLLKLSQHCLRSAEAEPTPRLQNNWDKIERSVDHSEARESDTTLAESQDPDLASHHMSAKRAVWLLRHEVQELMFMPSALKSACILEQDSLA